MNILILGETGVGKSTWINAFANFLLFKSLKRAKAGETLNLIPSKFTVCDQNYEEIVVSTHIHDKEKNEHLQAGQSATQDAKIYTFNIGKITLRLIDTPGIGDTRGIEQDRKNFTNILATISNFTEIHGICILLKPNNARLNIMFKFCILELLTHLHLEASKNIMICFTNSRGTFYRPGDTLPALKNILSENPKNQISLDRETVYCFDSESYRFLVALENDPPVTFSEDEQKNFAKSWIKSSKEVRRMLKHIRKLPPHTIQNTLNVDIGHDLLLQISLPIAEIQKNIGILKSLVEDEKRELQNILHKTGGLSENKMMENVKIEVVQLPKPRVVCTNGNCIKIGNLSNGQTVTIFNESCHYPCDCSSVNLGGIGDPGLIGCQIMNNGICSRSGCGHSYREHLAINYDHIQISNKIENKDVKESLMLNESLIETKSKLMEDKNAEIQKLQEEADKLIDVSKGIAGFVELNSMLTLNSGMEDYLSYLIKGEEDKVGGLNEDRKKLEGLTKIREAFLAEKKIFDREVVVSNGDNEMKDVQFEEILTNLKKAFDGNENIKRILESLEKPDKVVACEETVIGAGKYNHNIYYAVNKRPNLGRRILIFFEKLIDKNDNENF